MLIKRSSTIKSSEITSEDNYLNRRKFIQSSTLIGGSLLSSRLLGANLPQEPFAELDDVKSSLYSTDEKINNFLDVTSYNNYYEFGTGKDDPYRNGKDFQSRPWSIEVTGEAEKTGIFDIEDFVKPYLLEERIYRMRCVEAWSMVIPWVGIPLADIIKSFKPLSSATHVRFETLHDRERMPGQKSRVLKWPYREGLTMAEAMNPLPLLAIGIYGRALPNQNGAPIRLVVPWKYGFKGIKGIVKMSFVKSQPKTSWEMAASNEYGFYANVNPKISHPRWSQARERRIGSGVFASKQPTQMFNGYGEQVAHLYDGLNLRRHF
ncbi:MAG: sulfoxide reductase catalytic subunit YedY [Woeseiaceae bacterium]|jgi:sulfoxide reductase catalytic subunit YedY|tara:strand:- start:2617 stop:3576 length:960 start_codon:yes stop_codon:yes gene_type:complete